MQLEARPALCGPESRQVDGGSRGLGGSSEGGKGHQNLKGLGNLYVSRVLLHEWYQACNRDKKNHLITTSLCSSGLICLWEVYGFARAVLSYMN